jgi:hypothetical protein
MPLLTQVIDAEFVAAVLAALWIPLVVAGSIVLRLLARKTSKAPEPHTGRDTPPARRPQRGLGMRSRRPLPTLARPGR